jgi:hypothetical protein
MRRTTNRISNIPCDFKHYLKPPLKSLQLCILKVFETCVPCLDEAHHITTTSTRLYYTEKQISSVCRKFFIIYQKADFARASRHSLVKNAVFSTINALHNLNFAQYYTVKQLYCLINHII